MIKVLIVDDHALFRKGTRGALQGMEQFSIVGEASDGIQALEAAMRLSPDVVLMDLHMPRQGGLDTIKALQKQVPGARVLVLTMSEKEADLFAAVKAGAAGYLLKDVESHKLAEAVEAVARGEAAFSPGLAHRILDEFSGKTEAAPDQPSKLALSPREQEIMKLVAQGQSNRQIGESLFISENTVKTHLKNTLEKLHMHSRAQAAAYIAGLGLDRQSD